MYSGPPPRKSHAPLIAGLVAFGLAAGGAAPLALWPRSWDPRDSAGGISVSTNLAPPASSPVAAAPPTTVAAAPPATVAVAPPAPESMPSSAPSHGESAPAEPAAPSAPV